MTHTAHGRPRRPVIGVTTQTLHAIHGIPAGLPESWVMNQRYLRAVVAAGGAPVLIPLIHDEPDALRAIYESVNGIVIPGGVDMCPETYGEETSSLCGTVDPARDATELQLTRWAAADGLPVLGLCRGAQVINVACGGSLYQDIGAEVTGADPHDFYPTKGFERTHLAHSVDLAPGSRLRDAFGADASPVNSMHHQSVKRLGEGLRVSAVAPDGVVEAVEGTRSDAFLVGVQWHPEVFEGGEPGVRNLFRDFIGAATR